MPRYRITIEYDGTSFVGWQAQAEGVSVQGALRDAIGRFCGEAVVVKGAGRTDAGVHALGQVAHFDLVKSWDPFRVQEAMNFHLKPHPAVVLSCAVVDEQFDARFSAVQRHYFYRILCRRARPVLDANRVWWLPHDVDHAAIADAAQVFIGRHDFTTFRAAQCQAQSPVKTLDEFRVERVGEEIRLSVSARSFLHNQVRSMVGSLKIVGEGKWSRADLRDALEACDRTRCGPVAPAAGLYLVRVDYPVQTGAV
ncbi:MAG: tRNA pseudouridine(38-40) synthase TruA [Hyphomicrobiaceae bacterium]